MVTQQQKEEKRKLYCQKITQLAQFNGIQLGPINCFFVDSTDDSDVNTQHELSCLEAWAQCLRPLSTYG